MKTVKKATALITSILMAASFAAVPMFATDIQPIFKDVAENDWFCNDVEFAYENKVIKGITEDTFAPDASLSRAMAATMLYRMAGEPDDLAYINHFEDVNEGEWYFDAVSWAQRSKIVYGYSDDIFSPDDNITRADFAVMLMRYAAAENLALPENENYKLNFEDSKDIPYYSELSVAILVSSGIIKGKTAETFAPMDEITRAEASAMLHRFYEGASENKSILLSKYGFEIEDVKLYYPVMSFFETNNNDAEFASDSNEGVNYVEISLNKLYDDAELPECDISVEIIYSLDRKRSDVQLHKEESIPGFIGNINLGEALIPLYNEIYKTIVNITIGEETETLVYYVIAEVVW